MLKRSLWLTVLAFLLMLPAPDPARAACDYEIGESGTTLTATRTDVNEELTCIESALAAGGVADGDYGDVIVSGSGTTWLVDTTTVAKLSASSTFTGNNVFTAIQEFYLDNDNAGFGPITQFTRHSDSPVVADGLGYFQFVGRNASAAFTEYASLGAFIVDTTAGSVDGALQFRTTVNNTNAPRLNIAQGTYAQGETDQGAGTANFTDYFDDGANINTLYQGLDSDLTEIAAGLSIPQELSPAAADFLLMIDAGGVWRRVDWDDLPGTTFADGDYGDIVISSSGTVLSLDLATPVTGFGSGDKFPCFEAGVIKECDYDDLPGAGGGLVANDIDTSGELRAILTDEVGTGALMFGLAAGMTDDLSCTGSQVVRRDSGDTAFECATIGTLSDGDKGHVVVSSSGTVWNLDTAASITWTANQAFNRTSAGVFNILMQTTDDGAGGGPIIALDRISASPAASDVTGRVNYRFRDSGGTATDGAFIDGMIVDPTDTSEDFALRFRTVGAGSAADRFTIALGLYYSAGADQGAGTVNATNLFVSGTNISAIYQPLDSDLTAIAALTTNAAGRSILTLADPNADRIAFWDDSGGAYAHLAVASPLTISTTTLDVDSATAGAEGVCELATTGEVETGTDTTRCVTAAGVLAAVTGTKTISIPGGALIPGVTQPCTTGTAESTPTNDITHGSCNFTSTSANEYGWFQIAMPKGWDEGTISAQFYWTSELGTGNVVWGLACLSRSDNDTLDAALGTQVTVTDAELSPQDIMISGATGAHTIGGSPAEGDIVFCRVARVGSSGSDTFTGTAKLLAVKVLYTTSAMTDD